MRSELPEVRGVALPVLPGRVERAGRMNGRGSPALAGSLSYLRHLGRGEEEEEEDEHRADRIADSLGGALLIAVDRWRGGGDSIAQRWTG